MIFNNGRFRPKAEDFRFKYSSVHIPQSSLQCVEKQCSELRLKSLFTENQQSLVERSRNERLALLASATLGQRPNSYMLASITLRQRRSNYDTLSGCDVGYLSLVIQQLFNRFFKFRDFTDDDVPENFIIDIKIMMDKDIPGAGNFFPFNCRML